MILYEIDKDKWWDFAAKVLVLYQNESFQILMFNQLKEAEEYNQMITWSQRQDWHVELQVFEKGEDYFFRVLEAGYFFMNHNDQFPELILHFYDDHSDIDEEMEKQRPWVEWMDKRIKNRQYMLYPVIDIDSYNFN